MDERKRIEILLRLLRITDHRRDSLPISPSGGECWAVIFNALLMFQDKIVEGRVHGRRHKMMMMLILAHMVK